MNPKAEIDGKDVANGRPRSDLIMLGVMAPLAGLGAGVIGALFRLALEQANRFRDALIARMDVWGIGGFVLFVALAAGAAAIAAWMVRCLAPSASGSGIPRVMAVLDGEVAPAPLRVIPVKFLAGTLAIGSGLALGREGPTVQMGASIAYQIGKLLRRNWTDCRALMAAGAGAGFAVAFNAPIAGALFVFEGLLKRFEARLVIAALAASAVAIWVGRAIFGDTPEFTVEPLTQPSLDKVPFFVLLGIGAGLAGTLYNRTLLAILRTADRFSDLPIELRAAMVGAVVGAIAWFTPSLVGAGDGLAQQALRGEGTLAALPALFFFRLGLIAFSVAAGAPGGLLVPLLALGAELGLWIGLLCALAFPGMAFEPEGFALVGMAALFTAIVRAPLTAIVLVAEITANSTMLLPMILACFAAMLVSTLFGDMSILDSLKERSLVRSKRTSRDVDQYNTQK
ncbi:MAG: H(+)/Cl(-) exchange transporter ClcA [Propionivibrio sp.]|uniref:H(+)/Cl(-) exchange transporter ClcA n=1 Tax=Propionivibrio sp. TaxID=2212460 RepID=UPI001A50F3E5|nr:H(+)/Cl(-) exchange transporter ClcA [Propionivibrio sp.]MBL8414480.1 H(+)/Cl(-) exchange transporter ClcA [Propionivibrio sp.]